MPRPVVTGGRGSSTNGEGATSAHRLRDPFSYLVAGAGFDAIHNIFGDRLRRVLKLPKRGRRPLKPAGSTPPASKPAHAAPVGSRDASGDPADVEIDPIDIMAELRCLGRAA